MFRVVDNFPSDVGLIIPLQKIPYVIKCLSWMIFCKHMAWVKFKLSCKYRSFRIYIDWNRKKSLKRKRTTINDYFIIPITIFLEILLQGKARARCDNPIPVLKMDVNNYATMCELKDCNSIGVKVQLTNFLFYQITQWSWWNDIN